MREMSIRASARGSLRSVLDSVKAAELNDAQIASSMSLREQFAVFQKIWIYPISMVLLYATTLFIVSSSGFQLAAGGGERTGN